MLKGMGSKIAHNQKHLLLSRFEMYIEINIQLPNTSDFFYAIWFANHRT